MIGVPAGTQILADDEERSLIADLTTVGQRLVLLEGGLGGRGNASYKTSTNRAPRQHQPGEPGQELSVWLRLKLLADVGLVGLPNAGKSTFLNAVSNAKAKVGAYPFTTLAPEAGRGAPPGSRAGGGRHPRFDRGRGGRGRASATASWATWSAAKCCSTWWTRPARIRLPAWETVNGELDAYGAGLSDKPQVVGLNKMDLLDATERAEVTEALEDAGVAAVLPLSGATGDGVDEVLDALLRHLNRAAEAKGEAEWRP